MRLPAFSQPAFSQIVTLVSLFCLGATAAGLAEERRAAPRKAAPYLLPTLKLAKRATAAVAERDETSAAAEEDETDDARLAETAESGSLSHRRGAEKKKARAIIDAAVTPIERLQELSGDEVVLQPIIVRSTLADAMRRVALWGDCCPICGCSPAGNDHQPSETRRVPAALPRQQVLNVEDAKPDQEPAPAPLRAGEPAQVILDTQKRLGKSVTDGTEFGGSPELLIQWIRILDEENRRRQLALEEIGREEASEPLGDGASVTARSQVEALRQACRELQVAADLLEEQNLFESADSLRGIADVLRHQSRHKLPAVGAVDEASVSQPRNAQAKAHALDETTN